MKAALAVLILIGFPTSISSKKQTQDDSQAVRRALEVTSKGYYTGSTEKELEKLGDASAVGLIQIFGDRDISAAEIQNILLVVDLSFSAPQLVVKETDRTPRATLLLLRYLEFQTSETKLREKIAQTRASVKRGGDQVRSKPTP